VKLDLENISPKTFGRKSKMRISGADWKRILRSQTGFARIVMMAG